MKRKISYILIAAMALVAAVSCNTETRIENYLNLSVMSYMFQSNGGDSIDVEVMTNMPEWEVDSECDFVTVEKVGDNIARIKALPNTAAENRMGTVVFSSEGIVTTMSIGQLSASFKGVFNVLPLTARGAMSRNGHWYVYVDVTLNDDGDWEAHGYRINLKTNEKESLELPVIEGNYVDGVTAVSDDGQSIIFEKGGNYMSEFVVNGEVVKPTVPDGFSKIWLTNMNADGTVLVGSCNRGSATRWEPFKWINGEPIALETVVTDGFGRYPNDVDVYPRGCSDDGSIVYGSEWQTFGLLYWKDTKLYNIGIDNAEIISDDKGMRYISIMRCQASYWNISPNGKYIATSYRKFDSPGAYNDYPVRVDTEMGIYEYVEGSPTCSAQVVTDDGLMFGAEVPYIATMGMVFDLENGTSMKMSDWMMEKYGFIIADAYWCNTVSPDLKSFAGRSLSSNANGQTNPFWYMSIE